MVGTKAQLGEDGQVLEVAAMVLLDGCATKLAQFFDASKVTWSVAFPQLVVGRHPFVGRRLFVPVVFPACPLCGPVAAPSWFHHHERLHVHDLHDCHAVLLQSHHAMSLQDHHQS